MKEFKLLLTSDKEDQNQKAIELSKKIKLPFVGHLGDLKKNQEDHEDSFLLIVSEDLIYLKKGLAGTSKPIYCDFYKWSKENKKNIFNGKIMEIEGLPNLKLEQAFELTDATAERSCAGSTILLSQETVQEYLRSNI